MTGGHAAILVAAGFAAGAVNAVGGGGSLISFPALLGVGLGALPANVTNTVGLLPGYFGGTVAYRRELRGQRLVAPSIAALAGAGAGAALLLETSRHTFDRVVPGLILLACVLLAGQPLAARMASRSSERADRPVIVVLIVFAGAVYGAYFGAALGVMLLALLGLTLPESLQRVNALKSWLSLVIAVLGAAVFAAFGPVHWAAAGIVAAASLLGGGFGGRFARRLPDRVLRLLVVALGTGVAVSFLL